MFKQYGIEVAIKTLRPNAKFALYNSDITEWDDPTGSEPPTKEEIEKQIEKDKKIYDWHFYQIKRFESYPDGYLQLEMLWNDMNDGVIPGKDGTWFNAIKKIKEQFPKPTEPLEI